MLELMVVLALLSLLLGVSVVAVGSLQAPHGAGQVRQLEAARTAAIRSGVPLSVVVASQPVRFLPDGRALGPGVDPLTGAPRASR